MVQVGTLDAMTGLRGVVKLLLTDNVDNLGIVGDVVRK